MCALSCVPQRVIAALTAGLRAERWDALIRCGDGATSVDLFIDYDGYAFHGTEYCGHSLGGHKLLFCVPASIRKGASSKTMSIGVLDWSAGIASLSSLTGSRAQA